MAYFQLHVRDWLKQNNELEELYLPLHVIQSKGFEVEPEVDIKMTELIRSTSDNRAYKHFLNKGDGGIRFKISVIINRDERWRITVNDEIGQQVLRNPRVTDVLARIYGEMLICSVQTDAIDIPNGLYVLTKNSKRVQDFEDYTVWDLEFTTFYPLQSYRYQNSNSVVLKAISEANEKRLAEIAKAKAAAEAAKYPNRATQDKLKKCDWTKLKYSAKQTNDSCIKYMQTILKQQKFYSDNLDGWWGSLTTDAVKKFQTKYKSKYGLSVTGKMDKKTFDALCVVQ